MADPFANMNGELTRRIQLLIANANRAGFRISPGSGFRTPEEQARLRVTNGCPDVYSSPASSCRVPTAIPGRSNHNHGLAMDLSYGPGAAEWAAANAGKFGLHFPVPGENWHVEMVGDEGSRGFVQGAEQMGAIGFNINWADEGLNPEQAQDMLMQSYVDVIAGATNDSMLEAPQDAVLSSPANTTPEVQSPGLAENFSLQPGQEMPQELRTVTSTAPGEGGGLGQPSGGARFQGAVPPPGYVPPGEGVERWRDVAIAALKYTGQDPALVDILLRRMNQESGGNPMAVNNWDSNAKRGDPSKGLMQNIGSAFPERARELASRGIYDGFANMVASIRYALSRYGDLSRAYGRPGGY